MQITREEMLRLPRPTPGQVENFAEFLPDAHSWYKASLLEGTKFVVFVSPDAGGNYTDDRPNIGARWKTTANYRNLYGHLGFIWRFMDEGAYAGEWSVEHVELPAELLGRCSFTLYPWGAADGAALEVIGGGYHERVYDDWTKLESMRESPIARR